jgi:aspartate carbamoyltransferase catalytic subunit
MGCDLVVVRHSAAGTADFLAKVLNLSVINAGDGLHEHPTQALLDIFTILQHKEKVDGLTVTIVGDIKHSRVAHSDIWGLTKMGAKVRLCGPKTLIPLDIEREGVEVIDGIEQALEGADVVMALRLQRERQEGGFWHLVWDTKRYFGWAAKGFL